MTSEPRTILLVEDDPQDAELTLAALVEFNSANHVAVVSDGEQALDYLHHRGKFKTRAGDDPAVVLLDLKLPKVNGVELLKRIRSDEQLRTIPVVIFSSSQNESDLIECYREGVNGYVLKPLDFSEFMKAVKVLASFWAVINQPPPTPWADAKTSVQNGELLSSERQ